MDDIKTNADKIELMINKIESLIERLPDLAKRKAKGSSNYDLQLSLTILKIKNRLITKMIDEETGEMIDIPMSLPANLIDKVARGLVWRELLEKDESEAMYKGMTSSIDARKAQLNGYQSINKVLQ